MNLNTSVKALKFRTKLDAMKLITKLSYDGTVFDLRALKLKKIIKNIQKFRTNSISS